MQKLTIIVMLLLLVSCGKKSTTTSVKDSINNANYYLSLAKNSSQPQKSQYMLKAGTILAQKSQFLKAQQTFSFIDPTHLNAIEKESYYLFYGRSLQKLEQHDAAMRFFRRIQTPQNHDIDWQIAYQTYMSEALLYDGNYFEAAKIRIELEDLLMTDEQIEENHQFIWSSLNQITIDFLKTYQTNYSDEILNGWLEVVYLTRKNTDQPSQLLAALNVWRQRYPQHPANVKMPEELQRVATAKLYKPKQIALLLPLSGRLAAGGKMIRDGFFAAHYSQPEAQNTIIKVYDTAQSLSPLTPYQKAIEEGADFIVGPLTKEAVNEIVKQEALTVPQLSLNRADELTQQHREFYQFGLPIEDEAKQIAELAIEKQHKKAVILAPQNDQGDRTVETFQEVFELAEGKVAEVQRFDDPKEIKNVVKDALNIDLSEQRKNRLQQILGTPLEFTQRRRQDADMVFLSASPSDARRIKPFLNYYFAHDLPVYAVSRINSGGKNSQLNNDLNGIYFTDSPLLVSNDKDMQALRKDLEQIIPNVNSPFGRFFALGFDAYKLVPDLNMLQAFNQYRQKGLTGHLSVNEKGEIERRLSIAKFEKGQAREVVSETE